MVEEKGAETRLSLCNNRSANSRKASVDQAKRRERGRRRCRRRCQAIKVTQMLTLFCYSLIWEYRHVELL